MAKAGRITSAIAVLVEGEWYKWEWEKPKTSPTMADPQTGMVYAGDETALEGYLQKNKDQGMTAKAREVAAGDSDPNFRQIWEDEYGP